MLTNVEAHVEAGPTIFDRIFVPIDFTMSSHRALGAALELQATHRSSVCVFYAVESTGSDDWLASIGSPSVTGDWGDEGEKRLRRFLENVAPDQANQVEVMARLGDPMQTIRKAAEEWGATLIIAPAKVHAGLLELRSKGEHLVHNSEIPTLVLPVDDS